MARWMCDGQETRRPDEERLIMKWKEERKANKWDSGDEDGKDSGPRCSKTVSGARRRRGKGES